MKIICLGDSNTYGYDPSICFGGRYENPWPALLAYKLGGTAVNLGVNGMEIPHGPRSIPAMDDLIRAELPADFMFLLFGGNDLSNMPDSTSERVTERMEHYLNHLKETFPKLKIILLSPPAVRLSDEESVRKRAQLTPCYEALAEKLDIVFVKSGAWEIPLAFDGVHFTEEGHRIFAEKLASALENTL